MNSIQIIQLTLVAYISLIATIGRMHNNQIVIIIVFILGIVFISIVGRIYLKRFPNYLQLFKPDLKKFFRFAFKPWENANVLKDHIEVQKQRISVMRENLNSNATNAQTISEKKFKETLQNTQLQTPLKIKHFIRRKKKARVSMENIIQQDEINLENVIQISVKEEDKQLSKTDNLMNNSNFDETKEAITAQDNLESSLYKGQKLDSFKIDQMEGSFFDQDSKLESQQTKTVKKSEDLNEDNNIQKEQQSKKEDSERIQGSSNRE